MEEKKQSNTHQHDVPDAAIEKIEEAIQAVKSCQGKLTAHGYRELRRHLGHLMDALYDVGGALSKST
jgi:hypothetical protein